MKQKLLGTLLLLSIMTMVAVGAEAAETAAQGKIAGSTIAGLVSGDTVGVKWSAITGRGQIVDATAGRYAKCTGGTADPEPSTYLLTCKVTKSNIVGIGGGDTLTVRIAFASGFPLSPTKIITIGIHCAADGSGCGASATAALSSIYAQHDHDND